MNYIKSIIKTVYEMHTKHNWDTVLAIVGDEGVGKSTLGLHIADQWYTMMNGECKTEDIKHICLSREQWLTDLKDMNRYECTVYDEAGDLSSRRSMSQFNIEVMKTYQIIRADNLFTLLVLPSIWELDRYFRERRLRGVFFVYQRGRCAFWNKGRLREMLELNRNRLVRSYWVKSPLYIDNYPLYKGVLSEEYNKRKANKIAQVRTNIMSSESSSKSDVFKKQRDRAIKILRGEGYPVNKVAFAFGISDRTIYRVMEIAQPDTAHDTTYNMNSNERRNYDNNRRNIP